MINNNRMLYYFFSKLPSKDYLETITIENRNNNKVHVWNPKRILANEIRDDVKQFNNFSNENHIINSYELDKNYFHFYKLDAKQYFLKPKNDLQDIEFKINQIVVHIFDSNICFLDLGFTVLSQSYNDFQNFCYFLSEMKAKVLIKKKIVKFNKELNEKQEVEETISTVDFISHILKDFPNVYTLDSIDDFRYLYSKPVLFSYVFLDSQQIANVQNISHNYKESYKLNQEFVKKSDFFENSTWYYSSSSVSNVTYKVTDERTNRFFMTTFQDKFSSLYFILFLYSLHQKIYLIKVMCDIKKTNFNFSTAEQLENITDFNLIFKQKVEEDKLKYFFQYPSSIDHVNLFFDMMQQQFNIVGLMGTLELDLRNLANYLSSNSSILSKYEEIKKEKRKTIIDIVLLLLASLVTFASIYDTFIKLTNNLKINFSFRINLIFTILFLVLCFFIPMIINLVKNISSLKKNKRELYHMNEIINTKKKNQ